MNRLYDLHKEGAVYTQTKMVFDQLAAATVQYFKEEEAYMESIGFPDVGAHKIIHKNS